MSEYINQNSLDGDIIYHATATSLLPMSLYTQQHRHYLLDADLPPGFLIGELQTAYKLTKLPLEQISHNRAWVIWARDSALPTSVHERMEKITEGSALLSTIPYWQAAPIEIYLIPK